MTAVAALTIAAAGTYLLRHASVRAFASRTMPKRLISALRHAALAIIAAIAVAGLPGKSGVWGLTTANVFALTIAVVVARRHNMTITILATVGAYTVADVAIG
jgi:branched-subunit amino acid transport protein